VSDVNLAGLSREELADLGLVRASDLSEWITSRQLCEWLNVTMDWLYDRIREGSIPHIKVGRTLRFNRVEMNAYIERHRRGAA
jgi:excisionase family DNA binding protein